MDTPVSASAYSVADFCKHHDISKAMFYVLEKRGAAPKSFRVGRRRLISQESATAWRKQMESANA